MSRADLRTGPVLERVDWIVRGGRRLALAALGVAAPFVTAFLGMWLLLLMLGFHRNDVVGVFRNFLGSPAPVRLASVDLSTERTARAEPLERATGEFEALGLETVDEVGLERGGYRAWLRVLAGPHRRTWGVVRQSVYPTNIAEERALLSRCPDGTWVQTSDEPTDDIQKDIPPFILSLYLGPEAETEELAAAHRIALGEGCGADVAPERLDRDDLRAFFLRDRRWWFDHCAYHLFAMMRNCRAGVAPLVLDEHGRLTLLEEHEPEPVDPAGR